MRIAFCSLAIETVILNISIAPECLKQYNVCPYSGVLNWLLKRLQRVLK